jgi:hypothetical protein
MSIGDHMAGMSGTIGPTLAQGMSISTQKKAMAQEEQVASMIEKMMPPSESLIDVYA